MKKEELSMMEELILNSMAFDTKCPYCGRAVHIEPKDLIWQFGVTYTHEDGTSETIPSGFIYKCKCNKDIPVVISVGIDDGRVDKK